MMAEQSNRHSVNLSFLLDGIKKVDATHDVPVYGVAIDSREVRPGYLFMAYQGASENGCDYIDNAIDAGAAAIIWDSRPNVIPLQVARYISREKDARSGVQLIALEDLRSHCGEIAARFFGHPSRDINVIGITGTNGKTSCSHFLSQVLNKKSPCGVIGTLGYGVYGKLANTGMTTPDPVSLQSYMREMKDAGVGNVVMEVSSHALDQDRIAGTDINVAVFTNLSRDHLDYHDDMASYGSAKQKLFDMPSVKTAVLNVDDEFGRQLADSFGPERQCITYGMNAADPMPMVFASKVSLDDQGMSLNLVTPLGSGQLCSELLGRFNVSNVLAVIASLLACGYELDEAIAQAGELKTVSGRMERLGGAEHPLVVIDYAHTPDALEQVASTLREHCKEKLWCVFGCGGDRDRGKRAQMGEVVSRFADMIIITDDNPRFESPGQITDDILQGIVKKENVEIIHDRSRAIQNAVCSAQAGDIVLVAGKGHEAYQLIGSNEIPFSDREQVEYQLNERKARGRRS